MIKKVIVGLGLVGMVAFSGCSDSKESLETEKQELKQKCKSEMKDLMSDNASMTEIRNLDKKCADGRKDIKSRMEALKESEK